MNENVIREISKKEKDFVGYEYKDLTIKRSMQSIYIDGYENFGWILESISNPVERIGHTTLKFKRDRKLRNKAELTRLQRQFDSCVTEIEALDRSKSIGASTAAYVIGIIGTAFMAGSVFAQLAGMIPLSIILAIPGFAGWIIPYFCFNNIRKRKTENVAPFIDSKYDEIYDLCEKANGLLSY